VKKRLNAEKPKTTKKEMKSTSLTFGVGRVEKEGVNLLKCLRSQSVERIVAGGIFFHSTQNYIFIMCQSNHGI